MIAEQSADESPARALSGAGPRGSLANVAGVVMALGMGLVMLWLAAAPLPHHHQYQPKPPDPGAIGIPSPVVAAPARLPKKIIPAPVRPPWLAAPTGPILTVQIAQWVEPRRNAASSDSLLGAEVRATVSAAAARTINPGDSSGVAEYAVKVMTANTDAGAILKLQADGAALPAATFAPVVIHGSKWFTVLCGAFIRRYAADSLLDDLRSRRLIGSTAGTVVHAPYAFLIDSAVVASAVAGRLAQLVRRGLPAYALREGNGTAWILVGAFETPEQSALDEASLRAAGIEPRLVFRKGREF